MTIITNFLERYKTCDETTIDLKTNKQNKITKTTQEIDYVLGFSFMVFFKY